MKKTLLTLALVAVTAASFAQGKISIQNSGRLVTFGTTVKPGDVAGSLVTLAASPSGATFLVDLFGGSSAGNMILQTTIAMSGSIAGGFGPLSFTSPNLPGAVQATMQVKIRETGFATAELAQAGAGYFGFSPIFNFNPSSNPLVFNSLVNAGGTALSTWAAAPILVNYVPVPEPTSMALAGIGAAAMVIFRRRK